MENTLQKSFNIGPSIVELHFTLDLAENIKMRIIFSTYHEIRDERTSCYAPMYTSICQLIEQRRRK